MKNLERKRNVNCITDTNQDFCHILYWVTEYRYMYLIHMTWVRKHGSKSKKKTNFMLIVNRILMRRLFFLKGPMHNNFNEF